MGNFNGFLFTLQEDNEGEEAIMAKIDETPSRKEKELLLSLIGKRLEKVATDNDDGLYGLSLGRVVLFVEGRMIVLERGDKEYDSYLNDEPDEVYGFSIGEIKKMSEPLSRKIILPEEYSFYPLNESIRDISLIIDEGERAKKGETTHSFSVLVGIGISLEKASLYIYGSNPQDIYMEVRDLPPFSSDDLVREWSSFLDEDISIKVSRLLYSLKTGKRSLLKEETLMDNR